jgi:hypothetical protein
MGADTAVKQSVAWSARTDGSAWSQIVAAALAAAPALSQRTPRDIDAFCPGFRTAEPEARRAFYVAFLAEIARLESGLDPGANSAAPDRDRPDRQIVSRGLLRISSAQAAQAGCTATDDALYDPAENLRCGVRILDTALANDNLLAGWDQGWRGASRTWTSLRDRENLADVQAALNAKPYCRPAGAGRRAA